MRPDSPPTRTSVAATVVTAAGLGLALWLALVKWRGLPCFGGDCARVLYSRYGALGGVPVGAYATLLWAALVLILPPTIRLLLHALLAIGAAVFMAIQFGLLRAFCPYCTLHAAVAFTAWRWRKVRPAGWALLLGIGGALAGYGWAGQNATRAVGTLDRSARLVAGTDALLLLDRSPGAAGRRPVLVLSLSCPACLDLLDTIVTVSWPPDRRGAALYVKTDARDRLLAETWLAACLDPGGAAPSDRFSAATALLLSQRDLILADPSAAATWLSGLLRPSTDARSRARGILERQATRLTEAGPVPTPWLLPLGGPPQTSVSPQNLWVP
jgi:hypothetical protein